MVRSRKYLTYFNLPEMPGEGLEPSRPEGHRILRPSRYTLQSSLAAPNKAFHRTTRTRKHQVTPDFVTRLSPGSGRTVRGGPTLWEETVTMRPRRRPVRLAGLSAQNAITTAGEVR